MILGHCQYIKIDCAQKKANVRVFHKEIRQKIIEVNKSPAQHPAIQAIQDLFNTNEHRLYHWVQDRRVPPDNNLAGMGFFRN